MTSIIGKAYRHGAFGGERYSAHRELKPTETVTVKDTLVKPTDQLDSKYKKHDIEYAKFQSRPGQTELLRKSDRDLIKSIENMKRNEKLGFGEQLHNSAVATAFKAKLMLPDSIAYKYDTMPTTQDQQDAYNEYLGYKQKDRQNEYSQLFGQKKRKKRK